MDTINDLVARAEAISQAYQAEYAGRSRATRNPDALDAMIADLQGIRAAASTHADDAGLVALVDQWIAVYRKESAAIREVQSGGPDEVVAARVSDWHSLARHRYRRHFAGEDRGTRDLGLLDEIRGDLRRLRAELETAAANHEPGWKGDLFEAIDNELRIYDEERREIPAARWKLPTAEHGTALAGVANGQFELYRLHFDEKQRGTRNLALLERIVSTLKGTVATMEELKLNGFVSEPNDRNIVTVRQRTAFYEQELAATRSARASMAPTQRIDGLAEEANALFNAYRSQYAGKSRHDVPPEPLSQICDQLFEVARQMYELERETGIEVNSKNLETVVTTLKQYEREHERVQAVRS